MNNMWIKHFKAVVWKEFIEDWRRIRFFIPLAIIGVVGLQYFPVIQIVNNNQLLSAQKAVFFGVLPMYFSLIIIPFTGITLFSMSLYEEKLQYSIHTLLASGISKTSIWSGKFIVAAVYSYAATLITILAYFIFIKFYIGEDLVLTSQTAILTFISMPIASMGVLALVGWSYWAFKNPQIISMIITMVSIIGTWYFVMKFGTKYPLPIVTLLSLVIGIFFIGAVIFAVRYLPKERIISV
jgi:ABC-type transport system involved in multi-copper enzyme maturation permease subunit